MFNVEIVIYSFNFDDILKYQKINDIKAESGMLINAAKNLERSGADVILICSNTTNKTAKIVEKEIGIPIIDIIEVTCSKINNMDLSRVGLLATTYTINNKLYEKCLSGIDVILPNFEQQEQVHNIIYDELCNNIILIESKMKYMSIIVDLCYRGAEAIILGCTELPLLITKDDIKDRIDVPVIDTIQTHIDALGDRYEAK